MPPGWRRFMSVIFGIRNPDGQPADERQLHELASATQAFAPEGTFVKACGTIGMGSQPYRTHDRSILESPPITDRHGNMIAFDGRLDNHAELCRLLELRDSETPDSVIVLAAFLRWGENCFRRF